MSEFDEDRARELKRVIDDPQTDDNTRFGCIDEILDMCDPKRVAELASLDAFDALECLKELARSAKDPDVRHDAKQAVEQYERAREAYIRKVTDDDTPDGD